MKKIVFFVVLAAMCSCGNKQPVKTEMSAMEHERYIDSLVNVATGLNGTTLRQNRQNALDILREEYPELNERWDGVQKSINELELY